VMGSQFISTMSPVLVLIAHPSPCGQARQPAPVSITRSSGSP
jgi:hypothetical protein